MNLLIKGLTQSEQKGNQSFLIYGRRRVGKTYLLKKFLQSYLDTRTGIYLLCLQRSLSENLENIRSQLPTANLPPVTGSNFRSLFTNLQPYLHDQVIVFDEFQYLMERDPGILSDFQYIIDELLTNTQVVLILCGSAIGMIEGIGGDINSPLYGRFSIRLNVNPMRFKSIKEFHKLKPIDEQILIYSSLGGIALYHQYFRMEASFIENVVQTFFNPGHSLYSETVFLLRQELREISTYSGILHAIANGATRVTEIANSVAIPTKDISRYLRILINLRIIRKIKSITASPKSKRSIYQVVDNYFRFWYRFVSPMQTQIEFRNVSPVKQYLESNLSSYIGQSVEYLLEELLLEKYSKVGKWWYKDKEIDLVAINDHEKKIVFIEIKWTKKKWNKSIIQKLISTSAEVRGFDDFNKEYILISKNGFKGSFKSDDCYFWTLDDLVREFNL